MNLSIEIPVIRGGWLMQAIDSVLQQTSPNWYLTLYWDQGDELSKKILEEIQKTGHPRVMVFFGTERLGISRARQFLTEHSKGEFVVPLDDDDILLPTAVERTLEVASSRPWATLIRGRRNFIDENGNQIAMNDWFPFQRRTYVNGATVDISNQSQFYAVRRDILIDRDGWAGFEDVGLGEDCVCFVRAEEVGEIELIDETLYSYRIHSKRTSNSYTNDTVEDLWRRIAEETVSHRHALVRRVNETPPFEYLSDFKRSPRTDAIDVVIPFWETNENEVQYTSSRPTALSSHFLLGSTNLYEQLLSVNTEISRIKVGITSFLPAYGTISLYLFGKNGALSPLYEFSTDIAASAGIEFTFFPLVSFGAAIDLSEISKFAITFNPKINSPSRQIILHTFTDGGKTSALLRLFQAAPDHCRKKLDRGLASLARAGIAQGQIRVIENRASSSVNRNIGLRQCDREWVCLMDDDAELGDASTLRRLLDSMVRNKAGLSGPRLVHPNGRIYSGPPFSDPLTMTMRVEGFGEMDNGQYSFNSVVPWLPSTVLMIHRSVFHSTGGFDESFAGSQHEDVDFCLRARSRGFKCCYVGETFAIHDNLLRNGDFSTNMNYLKERWKGRPDLFLPILDLE